MQNKSDKIPCTVSGLNLFSPAPQQVVVDDGFWIPCSPISSIVHGSPIEILMRSDGLHYIDLANTQLFVSAQIVNADNTKLKANAKVGPANLTLESLFSDISISLNNTMVTSGNKDGFILNPTALRACPTALLLSL